jgi:glycoprotein endo-alpha-1,2-mannosidase
MAVMRRILPVLLIIPLLAAGNQTGSSHRPHRVLAFYYNWYGTPEREHGRWVHWNECRGCTHDPSKTVDETSPRTGSKLKAPDSGTKDHPAALYDSNDPAMVRNHLKIAERAGIDVLIATWWGQGQYEDQSFRRALDVASQAHSPVKFTINYETIPEGADDRVQAIIGDFRYLREQYGNNPAFFRDGGKPVFFIYGRVISQLKPEEWRTALAGIRALGPSILMVDCLAARCLEAADGVHDYNPLDLLVKQADMAAHYRQIVEMCRDKGKISAATVTPGYDDSNVGRDQPIVLSRDQGELYRRLWNDALAAHPDWVVITSFNEWHEGSEIEPSLEWGDLFVNLTREFASKFKESGHR